MKKTLKEYIDFYVGELGYPEQLVFKKYVVDNNLEYEYYPLIMELIESERSKMADRLSKIKEVVIAYNDRGSGSVHHPSYSEKENQLMDRWINEFAITGELRPYIIKEELSVYVPQMLRPDWAYIDFIRYVEEDLKLSFKQQESKKGDN